LAVTITSKIKVRDWGWRRFIVGDIEEVRRRRLA
jgi:hypothetical protein